MAASVRFSLTLAVLLGLLAVSGAGGCAHVRLPAIDPSGQRVFLPSPAYTTLDKQPGLLHRLPGLPQPAYVTPPTPPPCPPTATPAAPELAAVPSGTLSPGGAVVPTQPAPQLPGNVSRGSWLWNLGPEYEGSLIVHPQRLIAPVGTEVILSAAICGSDGYYITGQPLEWNLDPTGAGVLVDVGRPLNRLWSAVLHRNPRRTSSHSALGRTSTSAQVLTRGTAQSSDDVWLLEGQTWVSLTSNVEGVSRVHVTAPKVSTWDRRQQSAVVYWVDGQWALPLPAAGAPGQPLSLTTRVTRRTTAQPVAGWLVRYEVAGGNPASLGPGGSQAVEVQTDAFGNASISVLPAGPVPGTTQVRVQVIRTSAAAGDLPRLTVGEGWTSATWSAPAASLPGPGLLGPPVPGPSVPGPVVPGPTVPPGSSVPGPAVGPAQLSARVHGPDRAAAGQTLVYRVEISNPGEAAADDLVIQDTLPEGLEYVGSNPPGQVFGRRVEWRLGSLPGRSVRAIDIQVRADRGGSLQHCVTATAAGGLSAQACAATEVVAQTLSVEMSGPETASVGQQVQFRITVTNRGNQEATGVTVTDRFDPGLVHAESGSPIERPVGTLAAGGEHRFAVTFTVQRPGQHCHVLEVRSREGALTTARACVTGTLPPPEQRAAVAVKKSGPEQLRVGQEASFFVDVTNTGDVPLTNVRIDDRYDAELQPTSASPGFASGPGQLQWTLAQLAPGQTERRQVNCRALAARDNVCSRTAVTSDQAAPASDEVCLATLPASTGPPPQTPPIPDRGGPGATAPREPADTTQDRLVLTLVDQGDPIRVNQRVVYLVTIKNERTVSDKQVTLTMTLPDGLRFEKLSGPVQGRTSSPDGRTVELTPIAELRAGESVSFRLEATPLTAGRMIMRAQTQSQRSPAPVTAETDTTVFAP